MNNTFVRPRLRGAVVVLLSVLFFGLVLYVIIEPMISVGAAEPAGGTLTPASGPVTFIGGPFFISNPSTTAAGMPICNPPANPCDHFALTVEAPPEYRLTHRIRIEVIWQNPQMDFDVYIFNAAGQEIQRAAGSSDPEIAFIAAAPGNYTIRIVPWLVSGDSYAGTVSFVALPAIPPQPIPPGTPRYQNYVAPAGLGNDAAEPSIGCNWNTETGQNGGTVMYQSGRQTLRTRFDDCSSPAMATWADKTPFTSQFNNNDPILFTDLITGRTQISLLQAPAGVIFTGQSLSSVTDNDGETWTMSQGSGVVSGIDHQTIGGGKFNENSVPPPPPHPNYMNAVYYCSQNVVDAVCSLSVNGGITFGPAVPIYTAGTCVGIHGHVKVAPDGTVYVPVRNCGGKSAVAVSENNGVSWEVRSIMSSNVVTISSDPSLGIATDGTLYQAYHAADGKARIAVSRNKGITWTDDTDVGMPFGIQSSVFAAVVAGDPDRAAVAFLGTSEVGNPYDPNTFAGEWFLYIANTFDYGRTWTTISATPADPVQRGSICLAGISCGGGRRDRNLLDFNDATIDKRGRLLVAYADGCTGTCVLRPPNTFADKAVITRQSGGKRFFAQYDPVEPLRPGAPQVAATRDNISVGVHLTWAEPDGGGLSITRYNIYRKAPGEPNFTLIANTAKTNYDDRTADATTAYLYRVTAVNAIGESNSCADVAPVFVFIPVVPPTESCTLPGGLVVADPAGDHDSVTTSQYDIRSIHVAEPFFTDGTEKLIFTIKTSDLERVPPNSDWIIFFVFNNTRYYVAMTTRSPNTLTPAFEYGTWVPDVIPVLNRIDAAEAGTFDPNGTITITMLNDKIASPRAGNVLASMSGETRITAGARQVGDRTGNGTGLKAYRLVGNYFCRPQTSPLAAFTAAPNSGSAPLAVSFDGSASNDPDAGDTIAQYRFDFGDGSPISSGTAPVVNHTYANAGTYTASLIVTDSRGAPSTNSAARTITVLGPTAASVSVSGRVMTADGRGVPRARVTITNSEGNTRTSLTNGFGYYNFDEVATGETYVFSVSSKRYSFPTQIVTVIEDLTDLNFVAEE